MRFWSGCEKNGQIQRRKSLRKFRRINSDRRRITMWFVKSRHCETSGNQGIAESAVVWKKKKNRKTEKNLLFKIFWRTYKSFLWAHWYPFFGLLVTSLLGFKARMGSHIRTWWRCTYCRFTSGASPADFLAAKPFSSTGTYRVCETR